MSNTSAAQIPALVLSRTYDAPPQRLYEAWTDPAILVKFLGPGDIRIEDVKLDVRSGGRYSLVMIKEDGERLPVRGVYRDVQPNKRLAMTWTWEEDNPADEQETLLTLEFFDRAGKTEFVLRHEQFKSAESRENHQDGWTMILDQLQAVA